MKSAKNEKPDDWFFRQRAYPQGKIPQEARRLGFSQAATLFESHGSLRAGSWTPVGPSNIGGRITALGIHPDYPDRIFAGAADGGVLHSNDGGITWTPILDWMPSLSIGAISVHPTDPDIVFVGTGEANAAGDTYEGTGLYATYDGGDNWTWLGLPYSYKIGRIVFNPLEPDIIYIAVMGALYSKNPERGVYRSTDGGGNWEQCLAISDSTGAIDLAINPVNPNILYAAMWERIRHPDERRVGGLTSAIYRSTDGGDSWERLSNGLPVPSPTVGRIGLSLCASNPSILYAIYADHPGYFMGLYKTTDGGNTWFRVNDSAISDVFSSFGWYFGNVRVAPADPDLVFALGVRLYRSTDGGDSWEDVDGSIHVDHHALYIDPDNPSFIVNGNDGGVYRSQDMGDHWSKSYNLPITQFYAIAVDPQDPSRRYGGTQDNGTVRTQLGAVDDWEMILGGDGFYVLVHPMNSNIVYAEYQWGWLHCSTDGGLSFELCMDGIDLDDRHNWNTPVAMDPTDPSTLYYGSHRLYRSTDGGSWWDPISEDLTGGPGQANLTYGTITTIAVSPVEPAFLYVGTDDAHVWMTTTGGEQWTEISAGLPDRWVTQVTADPVDQNTAYVTLSGYRQDEYQPHVFRTADGGTTWIDIGLDLPEIPVNDIVVHPDDPSLLFVATDAGVYASIDTGGAWFPLGTDLPYSAVHDIALVTGTNELVAGTHGRSMFRFDLSELASNEPTVPRHNLLTLTAFPNPASSTDRIITVSYHLPGQEEARTDDQSINGAAVLRILDLMGRELGTLSRV